MEVLNYKKITEENEKINIVHQFSKLCKETGIEISTITLPTEVTTIATDAMQRRNECLCHSVLIKKIDRDCYFGACYSGVCIKCGAWCCGHTESVSSAEIEFYHADIDFENTDGIKTYHYNGLSGYSIATEVYADLFDNEVKVNVVEKTMGVKKLK